MSKVEAFSPDWSSAPGDTIGDILNEREITVAEFARRTGQTDREARDLIDGRITITLGLARRLEDALGGSVEFWMSRDFQYRQDVARLHAADQEWLSELPVGDMIKFGWLNPVPRPSEEVPACLRFFGVPNVSAWHQAYGRVEEMLAFRTSSSFDSRPAAVAAWLRRGEIESEYVECNPWNPERFKNSLPAIRSLTRKKQPSQFIPELQKRCGECGVAVVVVRGPSGCRASGATRFVSPEKALLLLSFRYLSDDHFWFTFFHEAGHLLLHGQRGFFVEVEGAPSTTEELQANEFAANILIPSEIRPALLRLPRDAREVIRFAQKIGVSPGIVVGQMQYYKRITYAQLNTLKRRFTWE
jgi:HTH-type transcriptional regulator/antitoxin HigA